MQVAGSSSFGLPIDPLSVGTSPAICAFVFLAFHYTQLTQGYVSMQTAGSSSFGLPFDPLSVDDYCTTANREYFGYSYAMKQLRSLQTNIQFFVQNFICINNNINNWDNESGSWINVGRCVSIEKLVCSARAEVIGRKRDHLFPGFREQENGIEFHNPNEIILPDPVNDFENAQSMDSTHVNYEDELCDEKTKNSIQSESEQDDLCTPTKSVKKDLTTPIKTTKFPEDRKSSTGTLIID
ncbi:4871_t:CDS:2 [Funneliformis mosseae]|uniref:4871_t:CDS:1 n=1 Tax=Funneliformis mosseae TaxID=27381 RepID=A0A9N9C2U0_FUNMO|nr:4871_t:CDS:2 [Funneliformis mosseae]